MTMFFTAIPARIATKSGSVHVSKLNALRRRLPDWSIGERWLNGERVLEVHSPYWGSGAEAAARADLLSACGA